MTQPPIYSEVMGSGVRDLTCYRKEDRHGMRLIRRYNMNRLLWLLFLTGLAVLLAGCGPPAAESLQAEQASTATPVAAAEQPTSAGPTEAPLTKAPSATPSGGLTAADVQRITPAEASALLDSGEAVLYDVQGELGYITLHAVGALSLPPADVEARFAELPTDKAVIFYCT